MARQSDASYQSDQNHDGVVDLEDLALFSEKRLDRHWQEVNWCEWLRVPHKHEKQLAELLDYAAERFQCERDPLAVRNANDSPTRLAWGPDSKLYVTDTKAGSLFIYHYDGELTAIGELKSLDRPLGVAISPWGDLYVGSDGRDRVEVYSPDGLRFAAIGSGEIEMPNDLVFDQAGTLYVADSKGRVVRVYDGATGASLGTIGEGELRFPVALALAGQELLVADQPDFQVKVFDLHGNFQRALGSKVGQGMLGYKWKGRFVRLQSLSVDAAGRLHAADSNMSIIQTLDPVAGTYLGSYASKGTAPGELILPLDIAVGPLGELAVANNGNKRVEILAIP